MGLGIEVLGLRGDCRSPDCKKKGGLGLGFRV